MSSNREDLLVLREDEIDSSYGSKPEERQMRDHLRYGVIILDKPQGPSSHEVAAWLRKMFGQERAGYSGTLDPPVSGMLPIGLGSATKALTVLLLGPKEYVGVARIHDSVPQEILQRVFAQFVGPIFQKPPQRSSVKRVTRTREIYELEILEQFGNLILFRALCESGTYIRKLVYDIGEVLSVGATMVELRRTRVCQFVENDLVRLHELHEAKAVWEESGDEAPLRRLVRPVEDAVSFLRQIRIRDSAVESLCQGAQLAVPGILSFSAGIQTGDMVRILSTKGELVTISECRMSEAELRSSEHGIAAITRRVVMEQGTYPKMWRSKNDEAIAEDTKQLLIKASELDALEEQEVDDSAISTTQK